MKREEKNRMLFHDIFNFIKNCYYSKAFSQQRASERHAATVNGRRRQQHWRMQWACEAGACYSHVALSPPRLSNFESSSEKSSSEFLLYSQHIVVFFSFLHRTYIFLPLLAGTKQNPDHWQRLTGADNDGNNATRRKPVKYILRTMAICEHSRSTQDSTITDDCLLRCWIAFRSKDVFSIKCSVYSAMNEFHVAKQQLDYNASGKSTISDIGKNIYYIFGKANTIYYCEKNWNFLEMALVKWGLTCDRFLIIRRHFL